MSYKKILSIDGGGIKGIFVAQFLTDIEEEYKVKICNYFDIIAGTSTGAIIAAALALEISAKEILELYTQNANLIFKGYSEIFIFKKILTLRGLLNYRYSNKNLKEVLLKVFSDKKVGDCKTRLLIPAFNVRTHNIEVFKTSHHKDYIRDYREDIVNVLLATTAAPTYFPVYDFKGRGQYIDGGIGANNPGMIAVIESIANCGWNQDELKLLSFGCLGELNTGKRKFKGIGDIIQAFMKAETLYSENIAKLLLNNKENYIRINPTLEKEQVYLDNISDEAINTLIIFARDESKKYMADIHRIFFDIKKEDFIPIHKC